MEWLDVKEIQNQQKKEYLRGYRSYVRRINWIVSEFEEKMSVNVSNTCDFMEDKQEKKGNGSIALLRR